MAAVRKQTRKPVKVTDEATIIRCATGDGLIREEVWKDADGAVFRYNLAFINFQLYPRNHGRVLGYDTAHGKPHRHFAGTLHVVENAPYAEIQKRFLAEVEELRKRRHL